MYTSIYYDNETNRIHLWDDEFGYKSFPYKKYFYIADENGEYKTLFGKRVRKIYSYELNNLDILPEELFESDISPEMRTLIDLYYDFDDTIIPENRIVFIDIEIEVQNAFPDINKAQNKITSICVFDASTKKYHVIILDEDLNINYKSENKNVKLYSCINERELLETFINIFLNIKPTIISGWNIEFFDIPYLINRMNIVLGPHNTRKLSPIGIIKYLDYKQRYRIAGISLLDYLAIYKKFNLSEEESYRLDAIAMKELGRGKTEFEGSLTNLYKTNIDKFIEYNINDVELVVEIDNKKKYLDLVIGISHKGKIPYEDIFYSSRYLEGAILSQLKRMNLVAPNAPTESKRDSFIGAFVKDPVPGIYEWIFDLDLTSLYPSIIMSLNISPETKLYKIIDFNFEDYNNNIERNWQLYSFYENETIEITTSELKSALKNSKNYISPNGIIYQSKLKRIGIIPYILTQWFQERVEYKNLMKKYGKENNIEKYNFYNKLQTIQKVLLNSLYGVLGLPVFRFYDLDNAYAVTLTGQHIIKFSEKIANEYFNEKLNTENKDYCIYIDTDSLFFSAKPLLEKYYKNDLEDRNKTINNVIKIATEVQTKINSAYSDFSKNILNIYDKYLFEIKQELIARSGLWTSKKRYAQYIVNKEGVVIEYLDVKGLDVVRSSFPNAFKGFMNNLLNNILKFVPKNEIDNEIIKLEKSLDTISIKDISRNTSVKNISKYAESEEEQNLFYNERIFSTIKKATPAHVAASIYFNDLLKYYNLDKKYPKIKDNEKIKWVYLKNNEFGIDKLAFRGYDDPIEIIQFIEKYIDREKIYETELKSKIETIYESLKWKFPNKNQEIVNKFFNFN